MQRIVSSSIRAAKSIVEMMIKIKVLERDAQDRYDQLVLGQHLSIEVFNDACRWVRENVKSRLYGNHQVDYTAVHNLLHNLLLQLKDSGLIDQETPDCNLLQLTTLMSHMDQYDAAMKDSITAVRSELNSPSVPFHYCSWIHNRLPGGCDQNQTESPRHIVNNILCTSEQLRLDPDSKCSEKLCM